MANIERLRQVLQLIKDNPQHWNQKKWHCGTSHCFAGFADCLAGGLDFRVSRFNYNTSRSFAIDWMSVRDVARKWLGLSIKEANHLFFSYNTLRDLENIINQIELGEL